MFKIAQQCKDGTLHLVKIPKKYRRDVGKIAEDSFEKAGKLFAYKKPVEVMIFPRISDIVIPEIGIGGMTTERGDILLSIDFSRRNIGKIITEQLPLSVYHELSHVVRGTHVMRGTHDYAVLLDWLVFEGIASYIERKLFKEKVPYIAPVKDEMEYWAQAQKILMKKTSYKESRKWFFGTEKLPRWI